MFSDFPVENCDDGSDSISEADYLHIVGDSLEFPIKHLALSQTRGVSIPASTIAISVL